MGLLSYTKIHELIEQGIITADSTTDVNPASVEIHLGEEIWEEELYGDFYTVDLLNKDQPLLTRAVIPETGKLISPGVFFLGHSVEIFNLPDNIVAEFVLKSSVARAGLDHLLAGYADPGFHGSNLTLEFSNHLRRGNIKIYPGMAIGQMKLYEVETVPEHKSYSKVGRYNKSTGVVQTRGVS